MPLPKLERHEVVVLYSVNETQEVTELDSPAPGCESIIATRKAVYEFFPSEEEARNYIGELRQDYMSRNRSLVISVGSKEVFLFGDANHKYAHSFDIHHGVTSQNFVSTKLPDNLEALLNSPQKRILEDTKTPTEIPGLPVEDLSKLQLF